MPFMPWAETRADSIRGMGNMYHLAPEQARLIGAVAARHSIPMDRAFGMVDVESSFRQNRRSPVGAVGMAQVRPEYAGVEQGFTAGELSGDPEANLDAGFGYLAKQYERFGDWDAALDAYNRGPTAARRAPKRGYARKVGGGTP
jgi:soluble lytic murein transglycosylase-like protein